MLYRIDKELVTLFLFVITGNMDSDSTQNPTFPCGKCSSPVTDDHQGLQCDTCSIWFHAPCQRVGNMLYDYLSNSNYSWHCIKCDSINYSLGSVSDLNSFASVNSFNALHHLTKAFSLLHHQLPQKDSLQRLPHPLPLP